MKINRLKLNIIHLFFSGALTLPPLNILVLLLPLLSILKLKTIKKLRHKHEYFVILGYICLAIQNSKGFSDFVLATFYLMVALALKNKKIEISLYGFIIIISVSILCLLILGYPPQSSAKGSLDIRLRLFTPEASHFGTFCIFVAYSFFQKRKWFGGAIVTAISLLAQSVLSLCMLVAIFLIKRAVAAFYLISIFGVFYLYNVITSGDVTYFTSNSGLIRLSGILVLIGMSPWELILGLGLGESNLAIVELLKIGDFEILPTFLFGFIADVGLLMFVAYCLITVNDRKEFYILIIILLNFPPLFPICPILLALVRSGQSYSEPI